MTCGALIPVAISLFQSSLGFGAERYSRVKYFGISGLSAFQSSLGFGAERYSQNLPHLPNVIVVSILARLWGRALPAAAELDDWLKIPGFNPRSALGPSATGRSTLCQLQ